MDEFVFRPARPGEETWLRPLWRECFGDGAAFWTLYETWAFASSQVELAFQGETLCAMMTLFPGRLRTGAGEEKRAACIYGLATLPSCRGQGAASGLLGRAVERVKTGEVDCLAVVPDTHALFPFYAKALEAETAFFIRFAEKDRQGLTKPPAAPRPIGAEGYLSLRRRALEGRGFLDWGGRMVEFQRRISQGEGGALFSFPQAPSCCAAAEVDGEGRLQVRELLGPEEVLESCLAGLMDALGCKQAQVRLPPWSRALGGETEPFAMVSGLSVPPGEEWYLGFDFA